MNPRPLLVARNVETSVGGATIVVCDNFEGGTGNVHELVVFGSCKLSVGNVDIVHLLHTTEIEEGTGNAQFDYCSPEKLLELAYHLSGIPNPGGKKKSGGDKRIDIGGDVSGNIVIGDHNDVKQTRW